MNFIKWFSITAVALAIVSCSPFEKIDVQGKFSIEIPDYMMELNLENPDAIFQYGNELKEHYVMVIMETHEELLKYDLEMGIKEYAELSVEFLKSSISNPEIEAIGDGIEKVNGMETLGYKIHGVFPENDLKIFYYTMFCRSEKAFYYVTTWTLDEFEDEFAESMERITHSIKEI